MTLGSFILSVCYTVVGLSAFVVFLIFNNFPAAILAIFTAIINIVSSHINFLHHKNKLQEWYTPRHLGQIGCFGFYCFAVSTSVLIYFLVIEIMEKKAVLPVGDSAVVPMIWAAVALKSGLMLLYFGRSYRSQEHSLLVEEPLSQENENPTETLIEP